MNGTHYRRTAPENLDRHRGEVLRVFARAHGRADARRRLVMWRFFLRTCAELWGYRGGEEWIVSHDLFRKRLPA